LAGEQRRQEFQNFKKQDLQYDDAVNIVQTLNQKDNLSEQDLAKKNRALRVIQGNIKENRRKAKEVTE